MFELGEREEARGEYRKWALFEEISWRQKSREVWLKERDRNTRFFHKMANAHSRINHMSRLKINGDWFIEGAELEDQVVRDFQGLLSAPKECQPSFMGLHFERLDFFEASLLERPFSEEVISALGEFSGDKAPGPDGFSMDFWQSSWAFVKTEVMSFFKDFF